MRSDRPRWADHWGPLSRVAARATATREGRDDHDIWRAIAADWQFAVTHRRPDAPHAPTGQRIDAVERAFLRACRALAKVGIDYASSSTGDRDRLEGTVGLMAAKAEAIETLLWHERQIRFGRPMILFLTDTNIMIGAKPTIEREAA